MDTVLEFVSDNYFWIILIAVILLMALIGYIAEQQGFGNGQKVPKEKKPKKEKKEKIKSEISIVQEPAIVAEPVNEDVNQVVNETVTEPVETVEQPIELQEQPVENTEKTAEPEEQIEEDLYAPIGDTEVKPTADLNIDRDFGNVLEDVEETADEADIELPKMDSVNPEELEEDEDIWKF